MTKHMRLLASASVLAVAAWGASPAVAADIATDAGTTIDNMATVSFNVGTVSQTPIDSNTSSFVVDRKVNLLVQASDAVTTSVAPGQTGAVTTFTVRNLSNQTLDFALTSSQASGGAAPNGGTDGFDMTSMQIYADTNTNGTYDSGTDTLATYIDELPEDEVRTIFVVATVPAGATNDQIAAVRLIATAREGAGAGSQGAAITETAGPNTAGVDTVFADTVAGPDDAVRQGDHSAADDYTVAAANLTINKTNTLISDPVNNTTDPKMIPGAVVEYCVTVANAAGAATATSIVITDTLPAQTTFVGGSIIVDGDASCANGSAGGSEAAGVVTAPLSDIAAGTTRSARFRATVN